ncbi:bifunctional folylpolyglutamate synthase/dihydrofolate synthase, partial [Vibrio cholerae HC-52A1]
MTQKPVPQATSPLAVWLFFFFP